MTAKSVPMQYEDKFHALARAVEVTEEEMQIAKFFWYAGLRHAFQRGTSSPALLEKPTPRNLWDVKFGTYQGDIQGSTQKPREIEFKLSNFPALQEDAPMGNPTGYYEYACQLYLNDCTLTPHEAKLLQLSTASLLSEIQGDIKGANTYVNFLWKNCDPNNPNTEDTFNEMNRMKNLVRRGKKQLATLNSAQRKLKKLAKGT